MSEPLNQDRVTELSKAIMLPIRENYLDGPFSQARSYEALNALASTLAVLLLGCDGLNGNARRFFDLALKQAYKDLAQEFQEQ